MRESKFIAQNKEKWQKYEANITDSSMGAEEMKDAFIELNDDLAYARTFYPNRAVRLFLNNLLAPLYNSIYKKKKWNFRQIANFFIKAVPETLYQARYFMLIALLAVIIGFVIGFFSTRYDATFAETVLKKGYIDLTQENIAKGDPFGIYKYENSWDMFKYIATNNLKVAVYFFIFGAFFCIGSLYLLLFNGIILGAFTFLFTSKGLTIEYVLTVYQHGTLEILTMVVEGAAGIIMGAGFLFPGTKSRLQSIRDAGKKSISIFLVCVPIIIVAAVIESYITRLTELPVGIRTAIIVLSLLFMLSYFIVYPLLRFRKKKETEMVEEPIHNDTASSMPIAGQIYPVGRSFLFAFDFVKTNVIPIVLVALCSGLLLFPLANYISDNAIIRDIHFNFSQWWNATSLIDYSDVENENINTFLVYTLRIFTFDIYASSFFFSASDSMYLALLSFFTMAAIIAIVLWRIRPYLESVSGSQIKVFKIFVAAVLASSFQVTLNILLEQYWWFGMIVFFPIQIFAATTYVISNKLNPVMNFITTLQYISGSLGKFISCIIISLLLYFMCMFGILLITRLALDISGEIHGIEYFSEKVMYFFSRLNYFIIPILLALNTSIYVLVSASIHETKTGLYIKRKINSISFKNVVYGIETE